MTEQVDWPSLPHRDDVPIGHPQAEPEDMGHTDPDNHWFVFAPLVDALPIPRRQEPWCKCGWHEANHPGYAVADHLRDMGVEVE